jgi:hypothetical protein
MAGRHRDQIPGGLADKSKPGDFDPDQLRMGIASEMEHTKDRSIAREIAMDHLKEDPRYYTKLKKIHKESIDMNLSETIGWLFDLRESLEEAQTSVKATGQTNDYLPGATPKSKKPPPVTRAARRMAGKEPLTLKKKKPMPTRNPTERPPVKMKKKTDDTADALSHIRKMNAPKPKPKTAMDKALGDLDTLGKNKGKDLTDGKKLESKHIAMIRRLIEANDREGGGSSLNSRERAAKGMGRANAIRRVGPSASKGGKKPMRTKAKRPMPPIESSY